MNQSNKKNLEFIINSGVNYFLQDSPRNWFENEKKLEQHNFNKDSGDKKSKIDGVIEDLDTLGPAGSDGQFIVATGVGLSLIHI